MHETREWRNRQTRWLQVPVPERAWGFNSPLAHSGGTAPDRGLMSRVGGFLVGRGRSGANQGMCAETGGDALGFDENPLVRWPPGSTFTLIRPVRWGARRPCGHERARSEAEHFLCLWADQSSRTAGGVNSIPTCSSSPHEESPPSPPPVPPAGGGFSVPPQTAYPCWWRKIRSAPAPSRRTIAARRAT